MKLPGCSPAANSGKAASLFMLVRPHWYISFYNATFAGLFSWEPSLEPIVKHPLHSLKQFKICSSLYSVTVFHLAFILDCLLIFLFWLFQNKYMYCLYACWYCYLTRPSPSLILLSDKGLSWFFLNNSLLHDHIQKY